MTRRHARACAVALVSLTGACGDGGVVATTTDASVPSYVPSPTDVVASGDVGSPFDAPTTMDAG